MTTTMKPEMAWTDWTTGIPANNFGFDEYRVGRIAVGESTIIIRQDRVADRDDRSPENVVAIRCHGTDEIWIDEINVAGPPAPTPEQAARADALDKAADDRRRRKEESFQRCDTDGFLSQWAHGINARQDDRNADILRAGGTAVFPALFDLQGRRVKARIVNTKYGRRWCVLDADGNAVAWIAVGPKQAWTTIKHGFVEGFERAPAKARISAPAGATGLGGAASCYVETVRTDAGFPDDAIPVENR